MGWAGWFARWLVDSPCLCIILPLVQQGQPLLPQLNSYCWLYRFSFTCSRSRRQNRAPLPFLALWHHTHHTYPWQRRNGEVEGVATACPVTAKIRSILFLGIFP
ncbi:hypothetical protein TGAM01_v207976 [Trichoderma gamsii]|uniref:Secreted protein n=1 Tax=Trichoderma gamsii TaxID=398673 RepID=A0A2P4ZG07_9HYPO|nr:hypothetical protein TGAM01_v207976 [Trichoderma gamsii]PON23203.1 hypothetical protein TGAM01_v207976 [Trichoderma gamsii]